MSKLPVYDMSGERVGEVVLADDRFPKWKGLQSVHDAVTALQAARRAGTASTKKRGEVAGGGIKPYKQKGTGRARAGSIRSPIWRGGGIVFGPHPRDFDKKLTRKAAQLAFCRAFAEKAAAGQVAVLDRLALPEPKTRHVQALLDALKAKRGALLVLDASDPNVTRAARNIAGVGVTTAASLHTYEIMASPLLVVSRPALVLIEQRIQKRLGDAS
jgi:large subunit ribosomal protein L4